MYNNFGQYIGKGIVKNQFAYFHIECTEPTQGIYHRVSSSEITMLPLRLACGKCNQGIKYEAGRDDT